MDETRFDLLQRDLNREFGTRPSLRQTLEQMRDWVVEHLERQGLLLALEQGR